ncbi:MAG: sigma-E factor negative regulatory protein RseA [Kiritimatiellia bacterium]|jgi:sigma-E factor negative regulatory protein RseA
MSDSPVKQPLEESLSALVDGEITELELRRLLKASDEDFKGLRARWLRFNTASAGIKKDLPTGDFCDLSESISAAIDEEKTYSMSSKSTRKSSIWSGVGRFAIAASVAGAVVLGVQFAPSGVNNEVADAESTLAPFVNVPSSFGHGLPTDTTVRTVSNEATVIKPEQQTIIINEATQEQLKLAEEEINRLMLEHAQNASQNTQQGVLPYARVPESPEKQ